MTFRADGVHPQEIVYRDARLGSIVRGDVNLVDFYCGIFLVAQDCDVSLMYLTGSITEPHLRTVGDKTRGLRELPVEVIEGKTVHGSTSLSLSIYKRSGVATAKHKCRNKGEKIF